MQCPKKYCFHWVEEGDIHLPFVLSDIKKAVKIANKAIPAKEGYCGCSFGSCIRNSNDSTNNDWYEPHELELENDGLPLDHFTHKTI
jgi:hypothetical protein